MQILTLSHPDLVNLKFWDHLAGTAPRGLQRTFPCEDNCRKPGWHVPRAPGQLPFSPCQAPRGSEAWPRATCRPRWPTRGATELPHHCSWTGGRSRGLALCVRPLPLSAEPGRALAERTSKHRRSSPSKACHAITQDALEVWVPEQPTSLSGRGPLCRDSETRPEEASPMTGAATHEGRRGPGAKITPQMPFPPNPFRSVSHYD